MPLLAAMIEHVEIRSPGLVEPALVLVHDRLAKSQLGIMRKQRPPAPAGIHRQIMAPEPHPSEHQQGNLFVTADDRVEPTGRKRRIELASLDFGRARL